VAGGGGGGRGNAGGGGGAGGFREQISSFLSSNLGLSISSQTTYPITVGQEVLVYRFNRQRKQVQIQFFQLLHQPLVVAVAEMIQLV
jgi:hypothetical protein